MTTFVLIPGAGGQASFWDRLVPELRSRGHVAIAVELPAGDDSAGLAAYADVVVRSVDIPGPASSSRSPWEAWSRPWSATASTWSRSSWSTP